MEKVWGYEYYGDIRTVDVTIRRIREKIENESIIKKYDENVTNDIIKLKKIISKISPAKVIVISNYCYNDKYQLYNGDINLNNLYFKYQNTKSKRLNDKVNYQIYSEIVKHID